MKSVVNFFLNGKAQEKEVKPDATVLEMLRNSYELNGTKEGCGEGDCGACTVVIGEVFNGKIRYKPVAGCLYLAAKLEGKHLITIEGLSSGDNLHPIQKAVLEAHATQCGFCTPGVIMSLLSVYLEHDKPDAETFRRYLEGNLCRCTGYITIRQVPEYVGSLNIKSKDMRPAFLAATEEQQLKLASEDILTGNGKSEFFSPVSAESLRGFLSEKLKSGNLQGMTFINGGSDVVVGIKKMHRKYSLIVDLARIESLGKVEDSGEFISAGGNVTLSDLADGLKQSLPVLSRTILQMCSEQIRSNATIAGNIVNASPVADTVPVLMAMGAEIVLDGPGGTRIVPIREFYHGYKQTENKPEEWIQSVRIPKNRFNYINFEKVSKRREVDISSVNSAVALKISDGVITDAGVAYGGVAPFTVFMPETAASLTGREFCEETFRNAGDIAFDEARPISDVRGSAEYRKGLLKNLMIRHFIASESMLGEVIL
ncbi:MAG: FAD binding domain-containing protein [Firmicutes bacterium]|nr:FAD binding domain-containing protein [Bacillota bacterium]